MRSNGPEPIIVQIKESLRTSEDLDQRLAELASLRQQSQLGVAKWYAGRKLLVMLTFPETFTEEQALAVIARLQKSPAVEKIVAQSAFNLEFKSEDFRRAFAKSDTIPDAARRGLDVPRLSRSKITYNPKTELPLHVANRVIVRWKDEYVWKAAKTGFQQRFAEVNALAQCTVIEEYRDSDHHLIQVLQFDPVKYSVLDQLVYYQANELVDYVQPDYVYSQQAVPNDPVYPTVQWNLPKISATASLAWSISTGADSVVVAVADTGANINHPDFATNLLAGSHRNFTVTPPSTNVFDDTLPPHGSNVASIIGAQGNNGLYMTGVSWNVSMMILKVFDAAGQPTSTSITDAIRYSGDRAASAINLSLGGYACGRHHVDPETGEVICDQPILDQMIFDALRYIRARNVVAVCAAGNNHVDIATNLFSPASVPTGNVISVAASDQNDAPATFTNFSVTKVDLAAPGVGIYGLKPTFNGNSNDLSNYSVFNGTSQATPHVTGTLALLKAQYGWENYRGLRDRVLMGTDDVAAIGGFVRTRGRLNANKALQPRTLIRNMATRARVESGDRIMIGGFIIGGSGTGTLKVAIRGLGPSLPNLGVAKLNNPKIRLNNSAGQLIYSNNDWGTLPLAQKNDLAANGLTPANAAEAAMVQTLAPGAYTVFVESQDGVFGVGLFEIYELHGGTNQQTRLINSATRCIVGINNERAISGMILGDPAKANNATLPKRSILVFGKGPSLPTTIAGRLANPFLTLNNSAGTQMSTNDSWSTATSSVVMSANGTWSNESAPVDELSEEGVSPSVASESALWPILKSGSYTVILSGVSNGTGIGLIEIYEY